jgi:UPF0755 protein
MTGDEPDWFGDDEGLRPGGGASHDQYGDLSPYETPAGWPGRPAGRDPYGESGRDGWGSRSGPQDRFPHSGASGDSGREGRHGDRDWYRAPDQVTGAYDPLGEPAAQDPYGPPSGPLAAQDPLGSPVRPDPLSPPVAPGQYDPLDPHGPARRGGYGPRNGYGSQSGYGQENGYGPPDSNGRQEGLRTRDQFGPRDSSGYGSQVPQEPPDPFGRWDAFGTQQPAGPPAGYDPAAGYDSPESSLLPSSFGLPDPYGQQRSFDPAGHDGQRESYDPPGSGGHAGHAGGQISPSEPTGYPPGEDYDRRPRHGAGNKQGRNRDLGPADYGLTDPTLTYRAPMGPQDHDWREYSGPGTGWPGGNGSGPGGDSPGPLRWRPPAAPNGQDPVAAAAVGEPAADPMARGRGTSPGPRRSAGSRSKLGPGPGDDRPGGPGRREHDGPEGGPTWEDDDAGPGSAPHDGGRRARDGSFLPGFADHGGGGHGSRPRRKRGRWLAPLISLIVLVVVVIFVGSYFYNAYNARHANYAGQSTGKVSVVVNSGDTAATLAPRLISLGVIKSADPFIAAAKNSTSPVGLEPGTFLLHKHMNAALAYALLVNPKSRIQSTVQITDGLRLTQILADLSKQTGKPVSQFQAALANRALGLPSYAGGSAKGYLYPATYNFPPGTSALAMLQAMVARFDQEAQSLNLPQAAKAAQLTEGQVITEASLLEAEGTPQYYAMVARVIDNRLNMGMRLGLDSTVLYALDKTGFLLTPTQLHTPSPYNTFLHKGLPPGPIDNPTAAAIQAALHPAKGNWLYFVTVNPKTGLTKFTKSSAQFAQFEAECRADKAC